MYPRDPVLVEVHPPNGNRFQKMWRQLEKLVPFLALFFFPPTLLPRVFENRFLTQKWNPLERHKEPPRRDTTVMYGKNTSIFHSFTLKELYILLFSCDSCFCSFVSQGEHAEHPRNLITELCRQFYHLGWVTGTGGGISIKKGSVIDTFLSSFQWFLFLQLFVRVLF